MNTVYVATNELMNTLIESFTLVSWAAVTLCFAGNWATSDFVLIGQRLSNGISTKILVDSKVFIIAKVVILEIQKCSKVFVKFSIICRA